MNSELYICQEAARHKPNGPFWTGAHWAMEKNKKVYTDEETAFADARRAVLLAMRPILVVRGDSILLKLKLPRCSCTQR